MKRVLWVGVGIGVGIFLVVKGRDLLKQFTPQGVQDRVQKVASSTASSVGERLGAFIDVARAAMAEREVELRDTLGLSEALDPDPQTSEPRRAEA